MYVFFDLTHFSRNFDNFFYCGRIECKINWLWDFLMKVIDTDMAENQVKNFEEDWTRMWKPQPTFASPDPDFRNWKSVMEWKRICWNKFTHIENICRISEWAVCQVWEFIIENNGISSSLVLKIPNNLAHGQNVLPPMGHKDYLVISHHHNLADWITPKSGGRV